VSTASESAPCDATATQEAASAASQTRPTSFIDRLGLTHSLYNTRFYWLWSATHFSFVQPVYIPERAHGI